VKKFFYFHLISTVALSSFFLKGADERKFRVTHGPDGAINIMGAGSVNFAELRKSGLSQEQILKMVLRGERPTLTTQGVEVSASQAIRMIQKGNFGAAKPAVAEGSQSEAIRRIPEGNLGAAAKPAVAEGSQEEIRNQERLEEQQREREARKQKLEREAEARKQEAKREQAARLQSPAAAQEAIHRKRMNGSGSVICPEESTLTPEIKAHLDTVKMTGDVVQNFDFYALRYKRSTHPEEKKRIEILKEEIGPIDSKEAGCFQKWLRLKQDHLGGIFAPVPVEVVTLSSDGSEIIRIQKTKRTFLITASYPVDFEINEGSNLRYSSMWYKDPGMSVHLANLIHQQENGFLCVTLKVIDTSKLTLSYTIRDVAGETHNGSVKF
jgi:hypothetical protein